MVTGDPSGSLNGGRGYISSSWIITFWFYGFSPVKYGGLFDSIILIVNSAEYVVTRSGRVPITFIIYVPGSF